MAILAHHYGSDWNAEMYDQIFAEVVPDPSDPPAGLLSHAASAKEDGWQVVEVWESQEALDGFLSGTVVPAAQAADMPSFDTETFEVHNTLIP